jgi:hypothetical protein
VRVFFFALVSEADVPVDSAGSEFGDGPPF